MQKIIKILMICGLVAAYTVYKVSASGEYGFPVTTGGEEVNPVVPLKGLSTCFACTKEQQSSVAQNIAGLDVPAEAEQHEEKALDEQEFEF